MQQATMETDRISQRQCGPAGPAKGRCELLSLSGDHATQLKKDSDCFQQQHAAMQSCATLCLSVLDSK